MADRFQVPVFVLTDQLLLDSYYNLPPLNVEGVKIERAVVETGAQYKRYASGTGGVSPRGVPGYGEGLVVVDSDEHDEEGHITEDLRVRNGMVDKRLQKEKGIRAAGVAPEFNGDKDYSCLIVGWGSTHNVIMEALCRTEAQGIGYVHCPQVYPLPDEVAGYMERAGTVIAVEHNATGQFAKLIRMETGRSVDKNVRKYNGLPFSLEEIIAVIGKEVRK
jgi:2-oxoglutarate ferredoxin oxidoreductase subunit alpha